MGAKITIQHDGKGWIEIFKSKEMQKVVDEVGERIAAEAGSHFYYRPATHNQFTVAGFVASDEHTGAWLEATEKTLTKAVHG